VKYHFLILFLLNSFTTLWGNTDVREWRMQDGSQLRAELVDYTPETGGVLLQIDDIEERILSFDDFSPIDQAWLVEWDEFSLQLETKLNTMGGRFEHIATSGKYPTDLYVYYPQGHQTTVTGLPAMILFHPGGKAARYCLRHMDAAETANMVLIACGSFRNTDDDFERESEMLKRFREVLPQILQTVTSIDHSKIYMGGTSGGAWRAYHYSAWIKFPWAGIYANGGWLGGSKYYNLPYPSEMRVIMVNGDQDHSNRSIAKVTEILEKAGNKVGLIAFEGGHQVPPTESQLKAFNWLLEVEAFIEE
jgi:predicted esterase